MRDKRAILLTFFFAVLILGAGYLAIVEQGKEILRSESVPERAEYENVGSNIFYGKIEDDIEIFPWNYYPENAVKEEIIPNFIMDDDFSERFVYEKPEEIVQIMEEYAEEEITDMQARYYVAADEYFGEMISHETGVDEEKVLSFFRKPGNHLLQNMVMSSDSYVGTICFYQEILPLEGKKYQVRIACSDWNIINFVCVEYSRGDKRERAEWKAGKKKMVEVLEDSGESLSKYFTFMSQLNDLGAPTIFLLNGENENAYLYGMRYLAGLTGKGMQGEEQSYVEKKMDIVAQEWVGIYQNVDGDESQKDGETVGVEDHVGSDGEALESESAKESEEDVQYAVNYSYQVVELKDMILILVQGDVTMGLYFDPINQKFCGYNFFYEY